jgi:putative transposase
MQHWPHAPAHRVLEKGTYIVTAATYNKVLHFNTPERLSFLQDALMQLAKEYHWQLQAWAILGNHYHFVAQSPDQPQNLPAFLSNLHVMAAKYINAQDNMPNRQVWWQYWDTHITYQYSYLSRLNYVNQNAVKHGLVNVATQYDWCSASWFERTLPAPFLKTVSSFKIDKVNVPDNF